jgi:hypothetical protein
LPPVTLDAVFRNAVRLPRDSLESELSFLGQILGFDPPDVEELDLDRRPSETGAVQPGRDPGRRIRLSP